MLICESNTFNFNWRNFLVIITTVIIITFCCWSSSLLNEVQCQDQAYTFILYVYILEEEQQFATTNHPTTAH